MTERQRDRERRESESETDQTPTHIQSRHRLNLALLNRQRMIPFRREREGADSVTRTIRALRTRGVSTKRAVGHNKREEKNEKKAEGSRVVKEPKNSFGTQNESVRQKYIA